jgi:hypothetical protein
MLQLVGREDQARERFPDLVKMIEDAKPLLADRSDMAISARA